MPEKYAAPQKLPSYLDKARDALGPDGPGLRGTAYDYMGNGDPATVFYRKASLATNAYSSSVAWYGINHDSMDGVTPGTHFKDPGPWQDQLKQGVHDINPLVTFGVEP